MALWDSYSILTTPEHIPTVADAIRRAFAEVGLRPTLKLEVAGDKRQVA